MDRNDALQRRLRQSKSRWLICCRAYKERFLAGGVWCRLQRLLAYAESVFIISSEAADELESEGYEPSPIGHEVEPPIRLIFVTRERVEKISDRREIPVRLGLEFLSAHTVALIPFGFITPLEIQMYCE